MLLKGTALAAITAAWLGCAADGSDLGALAEAATPAGPIAPLLEGLGDHNHPVSTQVALAQRYFDQGLILAYGFNHAEAARSFREAQRLDPNCAMAYWGEALVLGPNINALMEAADVPLAWAALQKAVDLGATASEAERAYIDALATRYVAHAPEDRSALDHAYADAMRELARRYPEDLDAQTLFAEALMDTTPWNYWLPDGEPRPVTSEVLETLDAVLAANPQHAGANHLYIHAVEAVHPEAGAGAADRLGGLAPGAGHLVHMPAHIYVRLGRYHDASEANERAIASDDSYITQCHAQGLYPLSYMPHNHHFLWYSASMEGRSERSIAAAQYISDKVDTEMMAKPGYGALQHFYAMPWYAWVRFGKWDTILSATQPASHLPYPTAVRHYARGVALARRGRTADAKSELDALSKLADDARLDAVLVFVNPTRSILQIARASLAGEIAVGRGDLEQALTQFGEAVRLEDSLTYDEPPPWHTPTRQTLGAALLRAGHAEEAERAYREDLAKYLENGWSLFGLQRALEAQGRAEEAAAAQLRFEASWVRADISLDAPPSSE